LLKLGIRTDCNSSQYGLNTGAVQGKRGSSSAECLLSFSWEGADPGNEFLDPTQRTVLLSSSGIACTMPTEPFSCGAGRGQPGC